MRSVKSRMPCRPGLTPVTSEVQAGNVAAGTVEWRPPHAPSRMSLPRTGRRPCSTHGRTRSSVAPSRPITSSGAATPGSVDVPEGAEPFLGGCVVAPLLARPGMGARLDARSAQLGAQGLRRRRLRRPYVAHLAGIAADVGE